MKGYIHSIETAGMVDGPGVRYVIFLQGCLLRCKFCHNADTWELHSGKEVSVEELLSDIEEYLPYYKNSGGGVTISGGEPLLQIDFIIELFKELKKRGIHTTIDTSAGNYSNDETFIDKVKKLLSVTDLVLLDIKHIDSKKHKELTGKRNEHILEFANFLSNENVPTWIRHVLVPGHTDKEEDLKKLSLFIQSLQNVEKIELLPYHQLGIYKWTQLGLDYPLKNVSPPTTEQINKAKKILNINL